MVKKKALVIPTPNKDSEQIIHIDASKIREGLPPVDDNPACVDCGSKLHYGIGLAGGGFGMYAFCEKCNEIKQKTEMEE